MDGVFIMTGHRLQLGSGAPSGNIRKCIHSIISEEAMRTERS